MAHPNVLINDEPTKNKLNGTCCIKHYFSVNDYTIQDSGIGLFFAHLESLPVDGDFAFSVNDVDYIFSDNPTEYNEIQIGATTPDTASNLLAILETVRVFCKNFKVFTASISSILFVANEAGVTSGLTYNFNSDLFDIETVSPAQDSIRQPNYIVGFCVEYYNNFQWITLEDEQFNDVNSEGIVCFTPDFECIIPDICPDICAPLFEFKPAIQYRIGKVNRYGNPVQDYIFDKPENNEIFYASDTCVDVEDCGKLTLLNSLPMKICGNDIFLNWFIPDFESEGFEFANIVTLTFNDGTTLQVDSGDITGTGAGTLCQRIPLGSLNCPILLDATKPSSIDCLDLSRGSLIVGNSIQLQELTNNSDSEFSIGLPLMSGGVYQLSFTVKSYLENTSMPFDVCGISVFLVDNLGNETQIECINGNQSFVTAIDLTSKTTFCEKILFRKGNGGRILSAKICDIMVLGGSGSVEVSSIEVLPILDIGGVGVEADGFTIDIEDDCCDCSTGFVFKNKWGKLESFHIPCATSGVKNVEFEEVRKCGDCKEKTSERLIDSSDVLTHIFDIKTSQKETFCQFLESQNKWIFENGRYKNITGISGSFPYSNKTDTKVQVSFSYEIGSVVEKINTAG